MTWPETTPKLYFESFRDLHHLWGREYLIDRREVRLGRMHPNRCAARLNRVKRDIRQSMNGVMGVLADPELHRVLNIRRNAN